MWMPTYHNEWQCGEILSVWESIFLSDSALYTATNRNDAQIWILFGWDGWFSSFFIDIINQILTVITVVCKHTVFFYINMLQQEDGKINVIVLFLTKYQIDRMAISIYGYMDFRTGSSAAVPNLVKRPSFFAPALCWWAWTIIASKESSSSSASRLSTRKMLSRIPSSIHLRKQLYTEFQGPRQSAPLRAIQTIPLSMVRLSLEGVRVFQEGVKMQSVTIPDLLVRNVLT